MITFIVHFFCWLAGFLILWRIATLPPPGDGAEGETLSVIIPARNESQRLPFLLASLKDQSHGPLEILVVDDHSEDDTAALAEKLCEGPAIRIDPALAASIPVQALITALINQGSLTFNNRD